MRVGNFKIWRNDNYWHDWGWRGRKGARWLALGRWRVRRLSD